MGRSLDIEVARVFQPALPARRYKGIYGGRGSAKSHFFAEHLIEHCILNPGTRAVCTREVQKTLKESAKRLLEDKIAKHRAVQFRVLRDEIVTPGDGIIIFQGMQDHNAESIKSLEGFSVLWAEEAQTFSARSLELIRPTIRAPGSQLWFSWNPRSRDDPVDKFFRGGASAPPDSVCIEANYMDNPWFPKELETERQHDLAHYPDRYAHIWLGEYEPSAIGAIWTYDNINQNRVFSAPPMGRIVVSIDPAISNEANSDEHGIIAAGIGADGRGYVIDDASMKGGPREWAERAVALYDLYDADAIVIETNQGGDMCRHTIQTVRHNIKIIEVTARRGKHVRAEPISALYSLGRVSHVGTFAKLESQMVQMTASAYQGSGSPDRVDALVWAFTELFPSMVKKAPKPIIHRRSVPTGGDWMAM